MLARALAKPSNLLVLDEPTNDLDLETLDVLEETLGDYAGTVILISHDRDFLDRVVSAVIVPEGDGVWNEYAGGYSDMLTQRGADIAPTSPRAQRPRRTDQGRRPAAPAKSKRSSRFNEKFALDNLPKQIAKLEDEIATPAEEARRSGLYARDRKAFDAATAAIAQGAGRACRGRREMAGARNAARGDRRLTAHARGPHHA